MMLPADERLDGDRLRVRLEREHGLEVQAQLAAVDRVAELVLGLELAHRLDAHPGVEQLDAAAALLGAVHREVGLPDEILRVRLPAACAGEADARPDRDVVAAQEERLGDRRSRSLGDAQRLALPAQVLAQDHELVPAVADHGVARPEGPLQAARDLDEQIVAGVVAEPVVDRLKPSRSRNRSASEVGWRRARPTATLRRSSRSTRFGRPVSGSWSAWWASRAAARLRSIA